MYCCVCAEKTVLSTRRRSKDRRQADRLAREQRKGRTDGTLVLVQILVLLKLVGIRKGRGKDEVAGRL